MDGLLGEWWIDLVKIDVEGVELDVLVGMEGLLVVNFEIGVVVEYVVLYFGWVGISEVDWEVFWVWYGFDLYCIDDFIGVCLLVEVFVVLCDEVSFNILLCCLGSMFLFMMNMGVVV